MIARRYYFKFLAVILIALLTFIFISTAISSRQSPSLKYLKAYGHHELLYNNQISYEDAFIKSKSSKSLLSYSNSAASQSLQDELQKLDIQPSEIPICKQIASGELSAAESSALQLYNLERSAKKSKLINQKKISDFKQGENDDSQLFKDLSSGFVSKQVFYDFLSKATEKVDPQANANKSISQSCKNFKTLRNYITQPLSYEEQTFPIAYSILIHKDFQMFERLLRSIYQPQNFYCIHVDQKAPEQFKTAVAKLISCFKNVFHPKRQSKVYYLHYSRVQADLNCLHELHNYDYKYVFNLCGQDYPLKTNLEIIRDLKGLHGKNEVESVDVEKVGKLGRVLKGYDLNLKSESDHADTLVRNESKDKKPANINYAPSLGKETGLFAGSAYFCFKKEAVNSILFDESIRQFFDWMKDGWSPDESIWATINRYRKLPGSYPSHIKYEFNEIHTRTRLVKWAGLDRTSDKDGYNGAKKVPVYDTCHGKWLRGVCVYGAGDVAWLLNMHHWFGNKFDPDVDPVAIDCLDVFLRKKALDQAFRNAIH